MKDKEEQTEKQYWKGGFQYYRGYESREKLQDFQEGAERWEIHRGPKGLKRAKGLRHLLGENKEPYNVQAQGAQEQIEQVNCGEERVRGPGGYRLPRGS